MANSFTYKTSVINGMVHSDVKLNNKIVIITGANTGIGYETALDLAKREAKVIMACRDLDKGKSAQVKVSKVCCCYYLKKFMLIYKKISN